MAEPVSSSIVGVVGLGVSILALASLFQTCLDVWEYVDLGKRYETKATRLACQLQTEKVRFYLWGVGTHALFFLYLACLTCNLEIPFSATVKSTCLELGAISAAGTDLAIRLLRCRPLPASTFDRPTPAPSPSLSLN